MDEDSVLDNFGDSSPADPRCIGAVLFEVAQRLLAGGKIRVCIHLSSSFKFGHYFIVARFFDLSHEGVVLDQIEHAVSGTSLPNGKQVADIQYVSYILEIRSEGPRPSWYDVLNSCWCSRGHFLDISKTRNFATNEASDAVDEARHLGCHLRCSALEESEIVAEGAEEGHLLENLKTVGTAF
jgi:hypothetical protein